MCDSSGRSGSIWLLSATKACEIFRRRRTSPSKRIRCVNKSRTTLSEPLRGFLVSRKTEKVGLTLKASIMVAKYRSAVYSYVRDLLHIAHQDDEANLELGFRSIAIQKIDRALQNLLTMRKLIV